MAAAARSVTSDRAPQFDHIQETLQLLAQALAPRKRLVRAGDVIYRAGDAFEYLCTLNSGLVKIVKLTTDGREQVVGLKSRGDWLGFDGIARRTCGSDAIAMDIGEVWMIRYDALLKASATRPESMGALHEAMRALAVGAPGVRTQRCGRETPRVDGAPGSPIVARAGVDA